MLGKHEVASSNLAKGLSRTKALGGSEPQFRCRQGLTPLIHIMVDDYKRKRAVLTLSVLGILANLFDLVTTTVMQQQGSFTELNPLLALLLSYNPTVAYLFKLVIGTWLFLPLRYCPAYYALHAEKKSVRVFVVSALVTLFVLFVALGINNLLLIAWR